LWLGRNLFVDVAFWKNEIYREQVLKNYLNWNTPFWLNCDNGLSMLNVKNVEFPFFKYRVFEENYINNEVGLLNVLNGEVRNVLNILKYLNIPFYKLQYFVFRLLNKFNLSYFVFYTKREQKNIYKILKFIINKRIPNNQMSKYLYYDSLLNFFKNIYNNRKIELYNISSKDVFLGSDIRFFNKKMLNNELPGLYYMIFKEMNKGFNKIVTDKKSYPKVVKIMKFLNIYNYIEITKK